MAMLGDPDYRRWIVRDLTEQVENNKVELPTVGRALAVLLDLAGECRKQRPFADIRPIITDEGLKWCCTHHPQEHCG